MKDPKDITVSGKQLSDILESHKNWLYDKGGERADLRYADLRYADLSSADLRSANLSSANLSSADLRSADLRYADLSSADLRSANLSSANLRSANLSSADLSSADLRYADLSSADLRSANLSSANLRSANLSSAKNLEKVKNIEMVKAITSIIPEGDIFGWKKCNEGIIKILVPAKAKRSNATGRKCRAEYAKDIAHFSFDGKKTKKEFTSQYDNNFKYKVGEIIKPDNWNENRWDECSNGIHFFITRWEAENY